MPDLHFTVESAEPLEFAAAPALRLKLRIVDRAAGVDQAECAESIQSVLLRTQIRIEPTRRRHNAVEQRRLFDLFGAPEHWSRSLRAMFWAEVQTVVPSFTGSTVVDLPVPCSYDLNVAAAKYFDGLEHDDVPLCLLFSGTVFYAGAEGVLQATQISWEREADFRLPIAVWRATMDHYYPNSAWLRIDRELLERLTQYKRAQGLAQWDQVFEKLLAADAATFADIEVPR